MARSVPERAMCEAEEERKIGPMGSRRFQKIPETWDSCRGKPWAVGRANPGKRPCALQPARRSGGAQAVKRTPCALDAKRASTGFDVGPVASLTSHLLSNLLLILKE